MEHNDNDRSNDRTEVRNEDRTEVLRISRDGREIDMENVYAGMRIVAQMFREMMTREQERPGHRLGITTWPCRWCDYVGGGHAATCVQFNRKEKGQ